MNDQHHYDLAIVRSGGKRQAIVRCHVGVLNPIVARADLPDGPIRLRIEANAHNYFFAAGSDEKSMQKLFTAETRYLSTEVAGGFTGVFLGLYSTGNGSRSTTPAYFDWFDYQPLSDDTPGK